MATHCSEVVGRSVAACTARLAQQLINDNNNNDSSIHKPTADERSAAWLRHGDAARKKKEKNEFHTKETWRKGI